MDQCLTFIQNVLLSIKQKQIPTDPEIMAALSFSGTDWNDQGDLSSCLRDSTMNFVEMEARRGPLRIFRGLCLPSYCNAEWLNKNKANLLQLTQGNNKISQLINPSSVVFTQFPQSSHLDLFSADFILITALLGLFVLFIAIAFYLSKLIAKNAKKRQENQRRNSDKSKHSEVVYRKTLEKRFLEAEKNENENDIEIALNKFAKQSKPEKKQMSLFSEKSMLFKVINCWNLSDNWKKVCQLNSSNKELLAFNCIRVVSFLQVILGHEFFVRLEYLSNIIDLQIIQKEPFTLFIYSCLYSVDVFFFLGGFFVAYASTNPKYLQLFSLKKKLKVVIVFFQAIVNRISRILPAYLIAMLIYWRYTDFLGDSPTWYVFIDYTEQCTGRWWQKILFIDNLVPDGQKCFGWGWYLSNDMQMFIFSLLLIIVYANHRLAGKISIIICFLTFQFVSLYYSFSNNYLITASLTTMPSFDYYIKPWTRSPPYFIALILGILYKEYQAEKQKDNKVGLISQIKSITEKFYFVKWVIYAFGFFIIFFLMFGTRPLQVNGKDYWSEGFQNFWYGSSRSFYVFGVFLILLPGILGSQDLLVRFMSSKFFQFLAKLTFSGYLIHYIILSYSLWSFSDAIYVNNENILQLYSTELFLTLFFSMVFVLLVEQPFSNLANLVFNRNSGSAPQKPQPDQKQIEQQKIEQKQQNSINNKN